ncbi:methyltransferase domain-containing protein [Streptomyces sp. p1417]|uniref:Methyltransferase domain-containing protein n=1 Tax=Streptomyces typhae TaxID=2681492 RepID=A0A6L6WZR8_9ACTN|nr:methyltransferase domain-containing protein [Streptomyces typhae]MVO86959.1 methyltransferase domain-containing protein [Streptomyces typhae]
MTRIDGHVLAGPPREAAARCTAFAALFDPTTFRHIERLGVGPGWRCWEVGATSTSVVSWLAKRVGPTGLVLATAVDTAPLRSAARPPVQVRTHDLGADAPPPETFDFVHARLVLTRVPDREQALRSMVRALRPGGRLLVEEADPALQPHACPDEHGPEQELANRLRDGVRTLLAERGTDLAYGRVLPRLLRAAGLRQVEADAYFPLVSPAGAALESATVEQVRADLVDAGLATHDDVERHLAHVAEHAVDPASAPLVSAWARKA